MLHVIVKPTRSRIFQVLHKAKEQPRPHINIQQDIWWIQVGFNWLLSHMAFCFDVPTSKTFDQLFIWPDIINITHYYVHQWDWCKHISMPNGLGYILVIPMVYLRYTAIKAFEVWLQWDRIIYIAVWMVTVTRFLVLTLLMALVCWSDWPHPLDVLQFHLLIIDSNSDLFLQVDEF